MFVQCPLESLMKKIDDKNIVNTYVVWGVLTSVRVTDKKKAEKIKAQHTESFSIIGYISFTHNMPSVDKTSMRKYV